MSPADPDNLMFCYNTWSLDPDRWEQGLSVSDLFSIDDARLWMPLLTQNDRRREFQPSALRAKTAPRGTTTRDRAPFRSPTARVLSTPSSASFRALVTLFVGGSRRMLSYRRGNNLRAPSSYPQHRRLQGHGHRGGRRRVDSENPVYSQAMVPNHSQEARYGNAGNTQHHPPPCRLVVVRDTPHLFPWQAFRADVRRLPYSERPSARHLSRRRRTGNPTTALFHFWRRRRHYAKRCVHQRCAVPLFLPTPVSPWSLPPTPGRTPTASSCTPSSRERASL